MRFSHFSFMRVQKPYKPTEKPKETTVSSVNRYPAKQQWAEQQLTAVDTILTNFFAIQMLVDKSLFCLPDSIHTGGVCSFGEGLFFQFLGTHGHVHICGIGIVLTTKDVGNHKLIQIVGGFQRFFGHIRRAEPVAHTAGAPIRPGDRPVPWSGSDTDSRPKSHRLPSA